MWGRRRSVQRAKKLELENLDPKTKWSCVFPAQLFFSPFALLLSSATILFCTTHQHHKERNTAQQYYESLSSDNEKTQFVCADEHY